MTPVGNGSGSHGVAGSLPSPFPSLALAWCIFVSLVTLAVDDLPSDRLAELDSTIKSIESQLTQPAPHTPQINSSPATVKTILDGGTGNVLATGWLKVLEGLV